MRKLASNLPSYLAVLALLANLSVYSEEVGSAIEVAAKAEGTKSQTWASAAWAEESKCWLVAWREGYLNEPESQIVCARVSADGKALDPTGIRLTQGKGLKDRPRVASDGKGFLVVWEDLKNGKAWNVCAARVSADGKALDADGVLVAGGGGDNQCRPDVAFTKGNYHVAWMSFSNGYSVLNARVSPDGKVLDDKGLEVFALLRKGLTQQAIDPVLVSNGSDLVAVMDSVGDTYGNGGFSIRALDGTTGGATGAIASCNQKGEWFRGSVLAAGREGLLMARAKSAFGGKPSIILLALLDKNGAPLNGNLTVDEYGQPKTGFLPQALVRGNILVGRNGVAFDGSDYLVVTEMGDKERVIGGWRVSADGKIADAKGFVIAAESGKNEMLPFAAGGPKGAILVLYSELRGADDIKVLARIVK